MEPKKLSGFTLIEILLVVALIALLAGIVIVAVNPGKQLAEGRNVRRRADVTTLLNGIYQYSIDNNGKIPSGIQKDTNCHNAASGEICKNGSDCSGFTSLDALTQNQTYLADLPVDPSLPATATGTGYFVNQSENGRVTVCAPNSEPEGSPVISVTR